MRNLLVALIGIAITFSASAQSTVQQGNGSTSAVEWRMNASASRGGSTKVQCLPGSISSGNVGPYVPGTAIAHQPYASRKAVEIQNNGLDPICCSVNGTAPNAACNNGRRIAPAAAAGQAGGVWALDVSATVVIRCINMASGDQSGNDCTTITELK